MHMHETAGCSGWDKKSVQRALRWILGTSKFRIWHGVTLDDFYVRFEGGRYVWVRTRRRFYLIAITDEGGGYSGLRLADPAELKPKPEMDTKVFRLED